MDRGAWWAIVHGVAKSWTWLTKHSTHSTWCYCLGKQQKQHLKSFYLFFPRSSPFHIGDKFKITIGSVFIKLPVPHFKLCIDYKYPSHLPLIRLIQGFPGGSDGKESTHNTGDLGLIPGLGRSPGEGKVYPLQYSGLGSQRVRHDQVTFTFTCYNTNEFWKYVNWKKPVTKDCDSIK